MGRSLSEYQLSAVVVGSAILLTAFFTMTDAVALSYSVYTSIAAKDCTDPEGDYADQPDLGVFACEGLRDYSVRRVESDSANGTWLDIRRKDQVFSLRKDFNRLQEIGNFPVLGADKIEWRLDKTLDQAIALIVRVVVQDNAVNTEPSNVSRLLVVRLAPGVPCLLGIVKTNDEARQLADNVSAVCIP